MAELTPIKPPPRSQAPRPVPRKNVKPKAGKAKGSGPVFLAIAAVLVVSALVLWRPRSNPVELPAKVEADGTPKIIESTKQLKQMQAEGQKRTDVLIAERAAGLHMLPLQKSKGRGPILKVQVKSFGRGCQLGDWDIMRQDHEWLAANKSSLVLSLEEIGAGGSGKAQQKPVTIEQLREGLDTEFVLDRNENRRLMGLFLCSTQDDRPCQKQSQPNLQELSRLQMLIKDRMKNVEAYPKDNKIFFFHMLVAYPDRLLLHDSNQSLESSQTHLQEALDKGGKPVSPMALQDAMQRVRTSGSLPGIVLTDLLQIQLPHKGDQCH